MLNKLFCVSGRRFGDDDDTVGIYPAVSHAQAERQFLTCSLDFEEHEINAKCDGSTDPAYFIISNTDITDTAMPIFDQVEADDDGWVFSDSVGYWNEEKGWVANIADADVMTPLVALGATIPNSACEVRIVPAPKHQESTDSASAIATVTGIGTGTIIAPSTLKGELLQYDTAKVVAGLAELGMPYAIRVSAEEHSELDDEHWIAGESLSLAIKAAFDWEQVNCFERWHFCGGDIMTASGEIVGIVSSDFRGVSSLSDAGNDCYQRLPTQKRIPIATAVSASPSEWFK